MARLISSGRARLDPPLVRDARAEADLLRARAVEDAASIRARAEEAGRVAGEARAIEALIAIEARSAALEESASREVAKLALDVAARIVHEAVAIDAALLERIVLRALARARSESRVEVRLHPADRAELVRHLEPRGGLPETIQLVDAPDQARGGCVVTSGRITIDARIESALAAIERAMGVDAPSR